MSKPQSTHPPTAQLEDSALCENNDPEDQRMTAAKTQCTDKIVQAATNKWPASTNEIKEGVLSILNEGNIVLPSEALTELVPVLKDRIQDENFGNLRVKVLGYLDNAMSSVNAKLLYVLEDPNVQTYYGSLSPSLGSKRPREEDSGFQGEVAKPYHLVPVTDDFATIDAPLDFSMQPLIKNVPAVTGLEKFAAFVSARIDYLLEGDVTTLQYTRAIVVKNASGVGKTVGSIAVCQNLSKFLCLPIYLGLNSSFGLTNPEKELLGDKSIDGFKRVASVVGRRLLLQLRALVRECGQASDRKAALRGVLGSGEGWQVRMPLPTDSAIFKSAKHFPVASDNIEEACAALIKRLSEFCGGEKLAVLLIIDEGQFLDEFIAPAGDLGGARFALRFARNVQLLVSSKEMCALPLMTGINPVTSLGQKTTGSNEVYAGVLHSKDEFVKVVKTMSRKKDFTDDEKYEYNLLSAVFYPVARDAEWFLTKSQLNTTSNEIITLPRDETPRELAPLMLMAGGVRMELHNVLWHTAVPAEFKEDTFVPMPSCYHITSYINNCFWIKNEKQPKWEPIHGLGGLNELRSALRPSADAFEATCGRVFTLILALASTPIWKSASDWQSWDQKYSFSEISKYYKLAQKRLRATNPWFCLLCDLTTIHEPLALDAKHQLLPTCQTGRTCDVFAVDGGVACGLFSPFKSGLDDLRKAGECYVLRCGGSAPVDFIYVILLTDKANGKGGCDVAIRLADAKHCSQKWDSDKPSALDATDVKEMASRFQQVANYLYVALKNECDMRVVEERSAIFTNRKPSESILKKPLSISTSWATDSGNCHPLSILSPETFNFPPLTDFLYTWRQSKQQQMQQQQQELQPFQ